MTLKGETLHVSEGSVTWPRPLDRETKFSVLPGLMSEEKIDEVLSLIRSSNVAFDDDPDTVDAMPTQEIYVHNGGKPGAGKPRASKVSKRDSRARLNAYRSHHTFKRKLKK